MLPQARREASQLPVGIHSLMQNSLDVEKSIGR